MSESLQGSERWTDSWACRPCPRSHYSLNNSTDGEIHFQGAKLEEFFFTGLRCVIVTVMFVITSEWEGVWKT